MDAENAGSKELDRNGNATKTIDPRSNQEKNIEGLNKAMAKLLKNYPKQK